MATSDQSNVSPEHIQLFLPSLIEGKVYADWIYDLIAPYIKGRIMEFGSGKGSFSTILTTHNISLHVSDSIKANRDILRSKFKELSLVKGVHNLDSYRSDFNQFYSKYLGVFDTVIASNIHEYGFFHEMAIEKAKSLLGKGGHLMILVPAPTTLYYGIEQDDNDYNRYNLRLLKRLLNDEFDILITRYFNDLYDLEDIPSRHLGLTVLMVLRKK